MTTTTTQDVKTALDEHLRDLRMPAIRDGYRAAAERAAKDNLGYEEYLLELLEQESQMREQTRVERVLRQSRLPLDKDLASFDLKRFPPKIMQPIRTLLDGSFVARREPA